MIISVMASYEQLRNFIEYKFKQGGPVTVEDMVGLRMREPTLHILNKDHEVSDGEVSSDSESSSDLSLPEDERKVVKKKKKLSKKVIVNEKDIEKLKEDFEKNFDPNIDRTGNIKLHFKRKYEDTEKGVCMEARKLCEIKKKANCKLLIIYVKIGESLEKLHDKYFKSKRKPGQKFENYVTANGIDFSHGYIYDAIHLAKTVRSYPRLLKIKSLSFAEYRRRKAIITVLVEREKELWQQP